MKKRLLILILTVTTVFVFALGLAACEAAGSNGNKQVPVYTGMSVSDSAVKGKNVKKPSAYSINNAKGYDGDVVDKNDNLNTENPFGNSDNIEDEIKGSLTVNGGEKELYYAKANTPIYITVHLSNPDNFEILSFTLNEKKYSNYMFENGSDMESLILKVDVGNVEGYVEYTIDAIKYVDGTEIKDVVIDGDKTIRTGVYTEKQPAVKLNKEDIGFNDIYFDIDIIDTLSLIELSEGQLYAFLYDGENIISKEKVQLGNNKVKFEKLFTNRLYQYAVVACYDSLDGSGFGMRILYKKALYTKPIVLFKDVDVLKDGIKFDYEWDTNWINKKISEVTLYKGNEAVKKLNGDEKIIQGLLSDTEYILSALYQNGGQTEGIKLSFKTIANEIPQFELKQYSTTQTSLTFELNETDKDEIGEVTKIELLHGDNATEAELTDRTFENLLSNNIYTVRVTYEYDLNDGKGKQQIVKNLDIKTLEKIAPTVSVEILQTTLSFVSFDFNIEDKDKLCSVTSVDLLFGEEKISSLTDLTINEFTNLQVNNEYIVSVNYEYDLNDGKGIQNKCVQAYADIYQFTFVQSGANVVTITGVSEDVEDLVIPETVYENGTSYTVTRINYQAMMNNRNLLSVKFPASLLSIDTGTFRDNSFLNEITFAQNSKLSAIGDNAFLNCNLKKVVIPASVKTLGYGAFWGNNKLEEVLFEEGSQLKDVGDYAFYVCYALTQFAIPSNVESIGKSAFEGCDLRQIIIPARVKKIGINAFNSPTLNIYCETESASSLWTDGWNIDCNVYYKNEWYIDNDGNIQVDIDLSDKAKYD